MLILLFIFCVPLTITGFWDSNQSSENSLSKAHRPSSEDDFFSDHGAKTNLLENSSQNMEQYMWYLYKSNSSIYQSLFISCCVYIWCCDTAIKLFYDSWNKSALTLCIACTCTLASYPVLHYLFVLQATIAVVEDWNEATCTYSVHIHTVYMYTVLYMYIVLYM